LGNSYFEENQRRFLANNEERNAGDLARFHFLTLACDQVVGERLPGDLAELGVYKGNTAFLIAQTARRMARRAYLFDTFEGFADADLIGVDRDKVVEFDDTELASVKAFVGEDSTDFIKGYFPESASALPNDITFALVHIDCDLYAPFRAGLEYFYPRLVPGGYLIMHDYSSLHWDGVERAVDEFFIDKAERIVPIPDRSGTVVIRKL
jgi:hypothetical protein